MFSDFPLMKIIFTLPAQLFGGKIPESQRTIRRTRDEVDRVRRNGTDPDGTAARMLQDGLDVARDHRPHHDGGICGAGSEKLPAGAKAAAVNAVAVSRQRGEGQL